MRTLSFLGVLLMGLLLAGCATHRLESFTGDVPADHSQALAHDVSRQLAAVYPPARTRLSITPPPTDAFGKALVADLRTKGYELAETEGAPSGGDPLRYVVDRAGDTGLYRVTVWVGAQSLTRAYTAPATGSAPRPAGAWVRKE